MVEEVVAQSEPSRKHASGSPYRTTPRRLDEITEDVEERLPVLIDEFSRVLGGGVVPGSVVLIGGDPGIGKSTLLLQTALAMAAKVRVLYVSGEESERQIKMRALRLLRPNGDGKAHDYLEGISNELFLVTETSLTAILEHIEALHPALLILDSVQTTYMPELESSAGSVSQVRETSSRLREVAKNTGLAVFLIGHVTKEGTIAGPPRSWSISSIPCFTWKGTGFNPTGCCVLLKTALGQPPRWVSLR